MARKHTGPKRRNTLTLDDDNALRLERLRKERDLSFKDAVNEVLRRGLNEVERPFRPQEPFRTKVHHGGQLLMHDKSVKQILAELDDEYLRKKLNAR